MYSFTLTAMTILASMAAAAPTAPLTSRRILAGGPAIIPIPSDCTLEDIQPADFSSAFKANDAFSSANTVFIDYPPANGDDAKSQETCLEQCYGYGDPEECISALWAENVSYVTHGVQVTGNICVMFGSFVGSADLESVGDGEWVGAKATNIRCPTPRSP